MKKTSMLMTFMFLGLFETQVNESDLMGDWVSCQPNQDSSYLYLTRFEKEERVEVFATSDTPACENFSKHVQAAFVSKWKYEVQGDEIHQTLLTEKVAIFDEKMAKKFEVSQPCHFKTWAVHLSEDCLIDASEFPKLQGVREKRASKIVKLKLKASKRLQLSDGLGDELIKWEKP